MIKLSDLSKIDIKDIDFMKLKDQLLERKELAVQLGVGFVAFIIVVSVFTKGQSESGRYKSQINDMRSKEGVITEYNKIRNDIDSFLKNVPPPLSEDKIVNSVADFADKNGVKILTFSPTKVQDNETVRAIAMLFSLQTNDYKNMVGFIADIERANNLLQVKTCSILTQMPTGEAKKINKNPLINFQIEVASAEAKP